MKTYVCRIDPKLKTQSDALFGALGMSLNTAINVFLKKSVRVGGFPFDVNLSWEQPNHETIEAMLEAERIAHDPEVKAYSVEEALEELDR